MPTEPVSLELLRTMVQRTLDEQRELRRDTQDIRTIALRMVEQNRRLERRLEEVRDDLELMLKAELMGRLGHFEAAMEARFDAWTASQGS